MTTREKEDNAEPLHELREILRDSNVGLRVVTPKGPPAPEPTAAPIADPPERNFNLELKIGNDINVRLDAKAAAASPPEADPKKAEEVKKGLWKWLGEKAAAGWRITVLAALEWTFPKKSAG